MKMLIYYYAYKGCDYVILYLSRLSDYDVYTSTCVGKKIYQILAIIRGPGGSHLQSILYIS